MALADNATATADLDWDKENLKTEFDDEELKRWGIEFDWKPETEVTRNEEPDADKEELKKMLLGYIRDIKCVLEDEALINKAGDIEKYLEEQING